ncbi:mechanosensitive ion channel family protein [Corynebacterium xerosis]|uniref:mechanosensitive ion channel family protein n=1 Tax=Corynebacterium xerosis TaxID=1725 RepID=UPI0018C87A4E|nr:mechanosensitive ion channel family protein [Corynebacterium xerosis]
MDFLLYLLQRSWGWIATNGLSIAALLILIVLVPRIRRFVIAVATSNMADGEESTKGRRALIGAVVYIVEMIAYFAIGLALLNKFGISLTAAAIPATVVSAAIGFGAQGVIGDLIGGVFIIAEKQYGIGDWVEFHSPSGTVQGDVVNMTLRATTIRTLNGEEVVVPNSQARMCVNYSSQWSRAVIEVPVPMTAGGSVRDLEERTLEAAQRAIAAEGVREHVLSEIRIQSSTELVAPTTMGLPWTVTMRLIADCEPGDQWLIERAVRAEIIDTWWDDYGEKAEANPLKSAEALTTQLGAIPAAREGRIRQSPVTRPDAVGDDASTTFSDTPATVLGSDRGAGPAEGPARRGEGSLEVEQANAAKAAQASSGTLDDDDDRRRSDLPSVGAELDEKRRRLEGAEDENADGDALAETKVADAVTASPEQKVSKRQRVRRVLSAGGRARPSTVVMIVALMILGMLNLATVEPDEGEEGVAGWLAPSRFTGDDSDADETAGDATGEGAVGEGPGAEPATTAPTTPAEAPLQQDGGRTDQGTGSGTGTDSDTGTGNTGTSGNTGSGTGTGTDSGTGTGTGTGAGADTGAGTGTDSGTGDATTN